MLSYPDRPLSRPPVSVLRSWRQTPFIPNFTYKCYLRVNRLPELHPYVQLLRLRPRKK